MGISKLISIFVIFHLLNVSKSEIYQVEPKCSNKNECEINVKLTSAQDELQIAPHKKYAKVKKLTLKMRSNFIRLTSIFCKTFPSIEDFYAFNSGISIVDSDAFKGCQNLKYVHLGLNQIKSIGDDLFKNNKQLTEINLAENEIENLSGIAFRGLDDLQTLELYSNILDEIKMEDFRVLPSLETILLHGNQLNDISVEFTQFPKLTSLTLFGESTKTNGTENKFPFEVEDHLLQQLSSKNISSDHMCYKSNSEKCGNSCDNKYSICPKSSEKILVTIPKTIPETTPVTMTLVEKMTADHIGIVFISMGIIFIVISALIIFPLNKCIANKTCRKIPMPTTINPIFNENQQSTSHPSQNVTEIVVDNENQAVTEPIQNNQNKLHQYAFGDSSLICGKQIGKGSFGQVYIGTLEKQGTAKTVAIKLIETSKTQEIISEISTMLKLEHHNIVKMHDYKTDPGNRNIHIIIMEYVAKGSILKYLETFDNQDNSNFKHFLELTKDIAGGLQYLFNENIVHRDLAARNILVTEDNHAKISDFGLARHCNVNGEYQSTSSRPIPTKWYSPEAIDKKTYTKMSDIWSFGVTMYEIFSYGQAPYQNVEYQVMIDLIKTTPLEKPDKCPSEIYEKLMIPCWKINPEERPAINQILITIDELLTENPIYNRNQQSTSHPSQNVTEIVVNNDDQAVTVQVENNQNKSKEYTFKDFILICGEPIGKGSFGQAFIGTLKKQGKEETVAIKLIETTKIQKIIPEISTMLKLEHSNIVKMHDYKTDPGNDHIHIIIMEYVAKGSILKYLETFDNQDNSNFKHFLELAKDIAKGLQYLFNENIVHRDLAARNILVTEDNQAKISDFGLARHCNVNGDYQCTNPGPIPAKWYSPEAIDNKTYTKMSDIWSFGVTMYEIFSYGEAPYQHVKCVEDLINLIKTKPLDKPDKCSVEIYEKLMQPCWKIDPKERPKINQILTTIDELLANFESFNQISTEKPIILPDDYIVKDELQ